jgi:hypothetical protein
VGVGGSVDGWRLYNILGVPQAAQGDTYGWTDLHRNPFAVGGL